MPELTMEEFLYHSENYDGVCLSCGDLTDGGVEPDAENYKCHNCDENKVMGLENALLFGHIDVIE